MKPLHLMGFVVFSILVTVQPVLANQPPGPNVFLAEILMLPVMILCSVIGGAYAVMRYGKARRRRWAKVVVAIIIIVLSGMHEGFGLLVAVLFGMIALARSFQMLAWGIRAGSASTRPAHLQEARAWRLLSAGLLLAVSTVFLGGMALAFIGYWPKSEEREHARRLPALQEFLIYQMASAQGKKAETGAPAAEQLEPHELRAVLSAFFGQPEHIRFESDDAGKHFTIYMLPASRFPFFPYNYMTSQPSYRADETGQIRMGRVHTKDALCPADAPVIWQVKSIFDTLVVALRDQNRETRLRAVQSLGQLRDHRAVEPLIAALQDKDEFVVRQAMASLGTLQDPRAVVPLVAILKDQRIETDPSLRSHVIRALGKFKDDRVIPPLISALQDSESSVQREAVESLQALQDMRVIEPLIALLKHGEPNVRRKALWVLESLAKTTQLGEDPVKWQQWWEKNQ